MGRPEPPLLDLSGGHNALLCHNHQWKKEIFRRKSLRVRNAKLASLSLDSSKKLDGSGDNTINMGAGRLLY
jgi:hypothetical protein